jgi:hypothetical protein
MGPVTNPSGGIEAVSAQKALESFIPDFGEAAKQAIETADRIGQTFRENTAFPLLYAASLLGGVLVIAIGLDTFGTVRLSASSATILLGMFSIVLVLGTAARAFEIWLAIRTSGKVLEEREKAIAAFASARSRVPT